MERKSFKVITLWLPLVFFLGVAIMDGPVWCVDSASYDSMDFSREPVYPLFLALLRTLFAKMGFTGTLYDLPSYLFAAVIIQSLLWSYSVTRLANYIKENYGIMQSYLAVLFQLAVAAINRFVAIRHSMYSETILTESLAMPLFIVANVCLWEFFSKFSYVSLTKIFMLCVLIASIRKQMLAVLAVWMCAALLFYLILEKEKSVKRLLLSLCLGIIAFVSVIFLDKAYNYSLRGVFEMHMRNSRGMVDTLMYTATEETLDFFSDNADSEQFPHLNELYAGIYSECVARGYVIEACPEFTSRDELSVYKRDWIRDTDYYASVYDHIGYDILAENCEAYVAEYFPELDDVQAQIMEDRTEKEILNVLIRYEMPRFFTREGKAIRYVLGTNILRAFILSVANISHKSFVVVALIGYIIFLAVFLVSVSMKRYAFVRMALIVMLGIVINSVMTGLVIFPQPRYMCYSMGLFYLTIACGILYSE